MLRAKKNTFIKINFLFNVLFLVTFFSPQSAKAQFGFGNSEITREIEKSLLFDKSTQEKFDVY